MSSSIRWGLGLRPQHFSDLNRESELPLLEILSDNLLGHLGGPALYHTDRLACRTEVVLHGVGLNLGASCDLDEHYLKNLRALCDRYDPKEISDHLCFTRSERLASYELLPLVRNEDTAKRVSKKIQQVQDYLGRSILIENISAYVSFRDDEMTEGEFATEIASMSGCGLLLDINNLYVNSVNFDFDPTLELQRYPLLKVRQLHIAGHSSLEDFLFDTHDSTPAAQVCSLFNFFMELRAQSCPEFQLPLPCVLEWDDPKMDFVGLKSELNLLRSRIHDYSGTLEGSLND